MPSANLCSEGHVVVSYKNSVWNHREFPMAGEIPPNPSGILTHVVSVAEI